MLYFQLWSSFSWLLLLVAVVVRSLSHVCIFATPWTAACQVHLFFTISQNLLNLISIESVMSSNNIVLCHLLLLLSIFPIIRVFSNELTLRIRWPKDWSFSLSLSPSNEYSGFMSFKIDWFDLLAVQGKLESSPAHFESINSLALSFIYGPTLISVHDYWKNHRFDYTDLCWQSNVSAF